MASFIDAIGNTIRSGVCSYLSTYNNFNDALYGEGGLVGAIPRATGRTAYRMLCNDEPPEPPPPPFTGGQCPKKYYVGYSVTYDSDTASGNQPDTVNSSTFVWGPIQGFYMNTPNNGNFSVVAKETAFGPQKTIVLYTGGADAGGIISYEIQGIFTADGSPDDCGNPPPVIPPPDSPSTTTNTSYETNNNVSVTVPINLTYAPVNIDVNGELNIPVRVNIPVDADVNFNANLSFNTGDITFNFGDSNYSPGSKSSPSCYDSPSDTPDVPPDVPVDVPSPDPDDPEPETIRLLRAAIVTVNVVPDGITEIFQDDNPNVFIPRLGNVQFLIRVGNRLAWTEEIAIKNKRQFVVCPWEGGAIDVRGTPQPNVVWNIAPVYAIQEQAVLFEDS